MNYLGRMQEEKIQLDERLTKLRDFMKTEQFERLDKANQFALVEQKIYMTGYQNILAFRIDINTPTSSVSTAG